jgi:hypothetical protein
MGIIDSLSQSQGAVVPPVVPTIDTRTDTRQVISKTSLGAPDTYVDAVHTDTSAKVTPTSALSLSNFKRRKVDDGLENIPDQSYPIKEDGNLSLSAKSEQAKSEEDTRRSVKSEGEQNSKRKKDSGDENIDDKRKNFLERNRQGLMVCSLFLPSSDTLMQLL